MGRSLRFDQGVPDCATDTATDDRANGFARQGLPGERSNTLELEVSLDPVRMIRGFTPAAALVFRLIGRPTIDRAWATSV